MQVRRAEPADAEAIADVYIASREATMPYLPELHTHAEHNGLELVELTDGSGNEEREPDARYAWRP